MHHNSFRITRHIDAPPDAVFAAFADTALRRRWFRLPGSDGTYHHEFRVGGGESATSTFTGMGAPPEHLDYRSRYLHIETDRTLVYVYEARVNEILRYTALATVQLRPEAGGTALQWDEQITFVAPSADPDADFNHVRVGTGLRLNGLDAALGIQPAGLSQIRE